MNRFTYMLYGLVVLAVSTITNYSMTDSRGSSARSWSSGSGSSYSSGGSGWSGGHK